MNKRTEHPTVAAYLTRAIADSGKLHREIAREIGYAHPNVITMLKKGHTKLPLNKVGPIANALHVDPAELLQIAMAEYVPDTWAAIKDTIGPASLTVGERRMLKSYRELMIKCA